MYRILLKSDKPNLFMILMNVFPFESNKKSIWQTESRMQLGVENQKNFQLHKLYMHHTVPPPKKIWYSTR